MPSITSITVSCSTYHILLGNLQRIQQQQKSIQNVFYCITKMFHVHVTGLVDTRNPSVTDLGTFFFFALSLRLFHAHFSAESKQAF